MTKPALVYDASWKTETLDLAYESAVKSHAVSVDATVAIDAKLVTICTVASVLLGLSTVVHLNGPFLLAAIGFWAVAIAVGLWTYRAQDVRVMDPRVIVDPRWLSLEAAAYQSHTIEDLARAYGHNHALAERKARGLFIAMCCVAGEVGALALARLLA
jgi:hypothetical protein